MTRRVTLRPQARRDLGDIWKYTSRAWDVAQADVYTGSIWSAIDKLAAQPELGSDRGYVRPGLRKFTVGSHAIYYFYDDIVLRVTRILHVRMDIDAAL